MNTLDFGVGPEDLRNATRRRRQEAHNSVYLFQPGCKWAISGVLVLSNNAQFAAGKQKSGE